MALPDFHPLVSDWFTSALGVPTEAQRRGWEAIRGRRHTLIAAPTGSGKTLAAFLTAIDDLRQSIGLQAYAQVDPLVAFKREGHDMFQQLLGNIRKQVARTVFKVRVVEQRPAQQAAMPADAVAEKPDPESVTQAAPAPAPAPVAAPVLGSSSTPNPDSLRTNRGDDEGKGKSSKAAARRKMMR